MPIPILARVGAAVLGGGAPRSTGKAHIPAFGVEIKGLNEVVDALNAVEATARSQALRSATRDQMAKVIRTARNLVPQDTGTLRRSLAVRTRQRHTTTTAWGGVKSDITLDGRLTVIYGAAQEFGFMAGTRNATMYHGKDINRNRRRIYSSGRFIPPQPFIRPAWQQHVGAIPREFSLDFGPAITRAAAKHAKRKRTRLAKGAKVVA